MARIENTSARKYEINWGGAPTVSIPRCTTDESTGVKINGVADMPDDALDAAIAGDPWTKGVFESGDLVRVSGGEKLAAPKGDRSAAPTGVWGGDADAADAPHAKDKSKK